MDFVNAFLMEISLQIRMIQSQIKCLLLVVLLFFTSSLGAQTVVYSSDSLIKVSSVLSDDILLHESIADSLTIEIHGDKSLKFTQLTANDFVAKYKQSAKALNKIRYESEAYCDVVPNCDKILRLPFIKAIQQLDATRYALIGYVRAKSPVFIIRHIWVLDVSAEPKISKRILFLGNHSSISFAYNLSKSEFVLYQQLPRNNGIQENGVFVFDDNDVLTHQGITAEDFDEQRFYNFLKVAREHPQVGLGFSMFEIPSGNKTERIPPFINQDKPVYRIKLD